MTETHVPGGPSPGHHPPSPGHPRPEAGPAAGEVRIDHGILISSSPATGEPVGRFPVAGPAEVAQAVRRARQAMTWWSGLGFTGRRQRLLRWRAALADRCGELAELVHRESGKPVAEALVEIAGAVEHLAWAARHARRVLGPRRVPGSLLQIEFAAQVEYQPYGVVGVIGPWNYPVLTPLGSVGYALAAGNAVVVKPSEYTPATCAWLVDRFVEAVPEHPVLSVVYGAGPTGAALCAAGVDKLAFTGSTGTGRKVMAACADTLTPVLLECGGKDAMIVDADADLAAAVDAAVWGGMTNAGQTCVGIERVYVAAAVYEDFLTRLVDRAGRLRVGDGPDADFGPITMPAQLATIRRHIESALAAGGRAVLGGPGAVTPPYVRPTILVDVPQDAPAVREETFGPTLTVCRVADAQEGVRLANATRYGLGGAVFSRRRGVALARQMRSGMTSVNSVLSFAGIPSLPFGGVGDSGFGRVHGADGLREFARAKAIARRRMRSPLPALTFDRSPAQVAWIGRALRWRHGRRRLRSGPR